LFAGNPAFRHRTSSRLFQRVALEYKNALEASAQAEARPQEQSIGADWSALRLHCCASALSCVPILNPCRVYVSPGRFAFSRRWKAAKTRSGSLSCACIGAALHLRSVACLQETTLVFEIEFTVPTMTIAMYTSPYAGAVIRVRLVYQFCLRMHDRHSCCVCALLHRLRSRFPLATRSGVLTSAC
jgi:hypothetical protein